MRSDNVAGVARLPNLVLRPAQRDDAEQIAAVHINAWRAAYRGIFPSELLDSDEFAERRVTSWRRWRFGPGERCAVATLAKTAESTPVVVAFAWYGPERDRGRGYTGRGEINAFYADPRVWGVGVAAPLIDHTELRLRAEGFEAAVLWVLRDNPRARRFYERHGWEPSGIEGTFEFAGHAVTEVEYRKQLT